MEESLFKKIQLFQNYLDMPYRKTKTLESTGFMPTDSNVFGQLKAS